jgi:hypothetical protein
MNISLLIKHTLIQRLLCGILLFVYSIGALPARPLQAAGDVLVRDDEPGYIERGGDPAGFTYVTGWVVSNGGATFTHSNSFSQPDNYLKWKPPLPECGRWEVYAFIPSVNNNISDTNHAVYQVRHRDGPHEAGSLDTVVVDQGSYDRPEVTPDMRWHSLGTYTFSANAAAVGEYVLLGDNTGEGTIGSNQRSVNFDDLKWSYRGGDAAACDGGPTISDITVADIGDAYVERGGTAASLYDAPAGSITAAGHATWTGSNIDAPDNYMRWKPPLPVCGEWEIFAFIAWVNNQMSDTSHAAYHIRHRSQSAPAGLEERRDVDIDAVNQSFGSTQPQRWYSLGTYTFSADAGAVGEYVQLGDTTGEGNANQRSVIFDDMRWVYRGPNDAACQQIGDTSAPSGALLTPADGATIGPSSLRLTATASDNQSVNRVEFYANYDNTWHLIGTSYTSPYQIYWGTPFNLVSQPMIFTIHVVDNAGNRAVDPGGYHHVQYLAPSTGHNVVLEARRDLKMPYNTYRGCPASNGKPDPYGRNNYGAGCGGPYHGFHAGVCTDLVMDAYNAGLNFNIDDNIRKDWRPIYKYHSARYVEDMRSYFRANQTLLANSVAYQPGDVAFFDKNHDGIGDHALLVATVDAAGRPVEVIDNPSEYNGWPTATLAHPWNSGYDDASMGHGRLAMTTTTANIEVQDASNRMLVIEIDTPLAQLRLHDQRGLLRSAAYNDELIASNVQEFIPYVPGSTYEQLSNRVVLRVMDPLANSSQYRLETSTSVAGTYHLTLHIVQDGVTIASQQQTLELLPQVAQLTTIHLAEVGGAPTIALAPPHQIGWLAATPEVAAFQGTAGTIATRSFQLRELSGHTMANIAEMRVSDLVSPAGDRIAATSSSILPASVAIPAGGTRAIQIRINLAGATPNLYRGGVTITLADGTRQLIPIQIEASAKHFSTYLPLVRR